jgi:nicotinate (nicotinamide) nucleotide adenylyltransferase/putative HD superfamily hydrolase of NAD metabolism
LPEKRLKIHLTIEIFKSVVYNGFMINTAILGGSFDPVHVEHVKIAKAAVEELGVTRLVLLPTANPPHKSVAEVSFSHRVEMLKLAFDGFPVELIVDELEGETSGVHYMADNVLKLREKYGDYYYIIGGDSLWALESWYKPEEIAKNTRIAVFNRGGYDDVRGMVKILNGKWDTHILVMKYEGADLSSNIQRAKLNLGLPADGVPKSVVDYIKKYNLYNDFADILCKLPSYLSKERLTHSRNTTLTALEFNNDCRINLPFDSVFTAAILHDIGKKYDDTDVTSSQFDIPVDSFSTPVQHQFISAFLAEKEFGVKNAEILNAIRYHTTGRAGMSKLEKLVYVSDMLSSERRFLSVDELRVAVRDDFENGFISCLNFSYKYLRTRKKNIYPLTKQAVDYYKEGK